MRKAGESFKDDLKSLFEKHGSNAKLAAWLAGGAIVLGGLGYLMAPKNKNNQSDKTSIFYKPINLP